MRRGMLILVVGALALAGCGGDETTKPLTAVNLTELVSILPTPQGLDQSTDVHAAGADEVQERFAGRAVPVSARGEFARLGFKEAAVRAWRGADGRSVVVVASRWGDHLKALNVGGGAGQILEGDPGAGAWTPRELPGARGVRVDSGGTQSRLLSIAVEDISVVVRADGPVGDEPVARTLDLVVERLRAADHRA